MRAIRRTVMVKDEEHEKHNGHYAPTTRAEEEAQRVDHRYEDRLDELRLKAMFALGRNEDVSKGDLLHAIITQVGKDGFYWKLPGEPIPTFQRWNRATLLENERIFNATA